MSQSEQPATLESGASSGNNVSNQLKHQQTSPTSLNHHEHRQGNSDTPAKSQADEQQQQQQSSQAATTTATSPSKLLKQPAPTMAMHNFGPNSHHQQQQNDQKQQQHSKQASDNNSSWQGNQHNNNNNNHPSDTQTTSNIINNIIADGQQNISTSSPNNLAAGALNAGRQQQLQSQQQQHGGLFGQQQTPPNSSSSSNNTNSLQASLASRVDQIIRSTLNDTPHAQIPKNHPTNGSNMPSPTSASSSSLPTSMMFNPVSSLAAISSAHNHLHTGTPSLPVSSIAGLSTAAALSQLDSFYGTPALAAVSSGDILKNSSSNSTSSNSNNSGSNLLAKTSAHSASHSALAAAAALQSLNQSHLQRSQYNHNPQQQQQQSSHSQQTSCANATLPRPPSNSLAPQAAHGNNNNANSYMPKLGITSTTSSDHHNHNHLALSGHQQQQTDNLADLSARFQVNNSNINNNSIGGKNMPFLSSTRPPVSWQDQVSHANSSIINAGVGGGALRWQLPPPPPQLPAPPPLHHGSSINPSLQKQQHSSSPQNPFNTIGSTNLPVGLNISNSNNLIGQDGDNSSRLINRNNNNNNNDRRNSMNAGYTLDDIKGMNNNNPGSGGYPLGVPNSSTKQNTPWLDSNFKSPYTLAEAAARLQSQQQQLQQQRNSANGSGGSSSEEQQQIDRNTERLTLFAYNLMSTCLPGTNKPKKMVQLDEDIRHSIYNGEFYTRFEHIALGILTNQVMVPGFSIIDYIRRDKFSFHEVEKIENIHRKLGVSNFLCLIELAQQRPFLHPSPTKQLPLNSSPLDGGNTNNNHPNFSTGLPPSLTMTSSQQQQQALKNSQFAFLPPLPSRSELSITGGMIGLDKTGRSSQSPSDTNIRSHSLNIPKLHSAHSSSQPNPHGPSDCLSLANAQQQQQQHPNLLLNNQQLPPLMVGSGGGGGGGGGGNNLGRNNQNPSIQAHRSSPFQTPLSIGPPPVSRPPRSHSTIGGLGIGSLSSSSFDHHHTPPFGSPASHPQPPAAHQSSSRPNLANLFSEPIPAHAHSTSTPISAHMSSKMPQAPRLPDNISLPRKVPPPSPGLHSLKPPRGYPEGSIPAHLASGGGFPQQGAPGGRFDLDPMTGLLSSNNARQQQELAANRDFLNKRSSTPQSMMSSGAHGPAGMVDPHFGSRSPLSAQQLQNIYGNPLVGLNEPGLKTNANFMPNIPNSSSMSGPMLDLQKQNLMDPSKSMSLAPHLDISAANDAQMKQYSAIMAAYQQQQQQQQQQLMASTRSPNCITGPGRPPPYQAGPGAPMNPQTSQPHQMSSGPIRLEMYQSQQQQPLGLQSNQISPKQGSCTQRSIITGSGSAGLKKGKKTTKYSPPIGAQSAADTKTLNMGGPDMSSRVFELESQQSVSSGNSQDQQMKTSADASQQHSHGALDQQQHVSLDLRPTSSLSAATTAGQTAAAAAAAAGDRAADKGQAPVFGQSSNSSANEIVADFIAHGDEMPKNIGNLSDIKHVDADAKCQNNNSSIINSNQTIVSNYSNAQRNLKANEENQGPDALKQQQQQNRQSDTTNNTNNPDSSASNPTAPSKYQKLFTKKAWLKNYDQEDQTRTTTTTTPTSITTPITTSSSSGQETSDANNMILRTKVEVKVEKIDELEQKDIKTLTPIKANGNKTTKTNATKLEGKKRKKVKKEATLQPASRQSRTTGGGNKSADNDSEETNASTSELDDTDETDSLKSSNDKKLRRMPRRKVKLNSDKESDPPDSPKPTKSLKEVSRKRDKKQKSSSVTELGGKRKFNSDGSMKQKAKKLKQEIVASGATNNTGNKTGAGIDKTISSPSKSKKRVGDKFLQTVPCWEFEPKSIRCLECRRFRHSNSKGDKVVQTKQSRNNWDDFCRFFEFRKLRHNKAGHIVVAGFSDLSDAKDSDKRLWLPEGIETPKNINLDVATYILSNVGDQFCQLVLQERSVQEDYNSRIDNIENNEDEEVNDNKKITWKRAVNGLRELCDVCSTTLFNNHYVCERCGFVVCIDCYGSRAKNQSRDEHEDASGGDNNKSAPDKESPNKAANVNENGDEQAANNTSKKNKRDSHGWIYCAKNEEHSSDKLILTQIIAGDCLEEVWKLLHFTREALHLGQCSCKIANDKDTMISIAEVKTDKMLTEKQEQSKQNEMPIEGGDSEGSHSTLKGLLLATHTNSPFGNQPSSDDKSDEKSTDLVNGSDHNGNKSTLAHLNEDSKLFDFSNEDDSQDDSRQVSAAIEECIASLASKNQPGDAEVDVDPDFPKMVVDESIHTNENASSTHSRLYGGDLLVLSQPRHKDNLRLFRDHWRHGKIVIVRGIHELMDIESWSPRFFAKQFGDYRSDLVDCRNGEIHRTSMKKYWEGFEPTSAIKKKLKEDTVPTHIPVASNEEPSAISTSYYSGSALWRLKDWPPGQDFNEILPKHYEDFMNNLPLKSYTTRTGKLNLACRLPKEMLKPDLGPKMYSAYGTTKFPERGTTNLHLDISDAINVMVYVSGASAFMNGSTDYKEVYESTIDECCVEPEMKAQVREQKLIPGALWHIFKPSDAPKMREFLAKVSDERKLSMKKRSDPIHDQIWYLDQTLLDRLHEEYGVKAYAILQCMGDAILIPAGAPHQVKNLQNCIKVANDFVSPENVPYCMQLTHEFRSLPETHINQEDKLQIKNILYHSVKESLQYIKLCKTGQMGDHSEDEDWNNIQLKLDKWVANNTGQEEAER